MKFYQYISVMALACMSLGMTSCNNDGDLIFTSGGANLSLDGNTDDIVLDKNNLNALALTVYWNDNGKISTSDDRVAAPNYAVVNTIQFSASDGFASTVDFTMENGTFSKQFTHGDLNSVLNRLGYEAGVKAPLYIRVKGLLANNIDPQYSNVLTVNVTPYVIDMTQGFILNSNKEDTGNTLASPNSDGIYTGFMGATSWYNWYMQEGNGTIWGNEGENWTPFLMSSSISTVAYGNFWFPGLEGCYYTIVNTNTNEWSALLLPSLTVSGGINGNMEYDRKANVWRYTFTGTKGTVNIKLATTGKQYNHSTGTDDASAIDTAVGFGGTADNLTFGSSASNISVTIPDNGECTLKLDLSNPKQWTVSVSAGAEQGTAEVAQHLFLSGIDDGISGSWTFDNYLTLYDEDALSYGGMMNVNSLWGYNFYTEADNWDDKYGMADGGTGMEGTLVYKGGSNITAPEAGLYIFDVNLSALTYKLYSVEKVSYTGLNDDWSMCDMQATSTPGVYQATVQKTANTPWGVKILINESWNLYFGGGSGTLRLYHDGFDGDNDLANGTYVLTVDLIKGTYNYSSK
jgi:hypothetical protein